MVNKIVLLSFFAFCATELFAQNSEKNEKISELAKKNAQTYCECPYLEAMFDLGKDLQDKKLTVDEYIEAGKPIILQVAECTRPFLKEMRALSQEEYKFFSEESKKYRLEFCAIAIKKYENKR